MIREQKNIQKKLHVSLSKGHSSGAHEEVKKTKVGEFPVAINCLRKMGSLYLFASFAKWGCSLLSYQREGLGNKIAFFIIHPVFFTFNSYDLPE